MHLLPALRAAASNEREATLRGEMLDTAAKLRQAIEWFARDGDSGSLQLINGLWAHGEKLIYDHEHKPPRPSFPLERA